MSAILPKNYSVLELVGGPGAGRMLTAGFLQRVNAAEEETKQKPKKKIKWCPIHNDKKIKFFCLTCERRICSKCFATEHVRHTLERPLETRKFR